MKYRAAIFDLFGTLVPSYSSDDYRSALAEVSALIGAEPAEFTRAWTDRDMARRCMLGVLESLSVHVRDVARQIGLDVSQAAADDDAERALFDVTRRALAPRADAVATLDGLKGRGLKLALMSDCSAEAPALWPDTPLAPLFDIALFSCVVGMIKPEPGFYRLALNRLSVPAAECLYVGDIGDELLGARDAGMHALLICPPEEESIIMSRESTRAWPGPRIASLSEVLDRARNQGQT